MSDLNRRQWLAVGAAASLAPALAGAAEKPAAPFRFMFNTATIMGQKVPLDRTVDLVAKAGYDAIEPWIREIDAFVAAGGSLKDLGKRITDAGLRVESAIGFAKWAANDDAERKEGLEQARRDMDRVRALGGVRIAAPPTGVTDRVVEPMRLAERFAALVEVGDKIGVVPQAEVWGHSKSMNRLGEAALVALECGSSKACVLADVYHLHKGGSGFHGVGLLSAQAMQVFHVNDYPATPGRDKITDADRVYPGDGVAPLVQMLRDLHGLGFRGLLSLELFNRDYWKQDPATVARTGLEKLRAVAAKAMEK
jgi:2-keto-myo-inositol isomerase